MIKNKKAFSDGEVFKETMMIVANTVLKDEKHGPEVISALSDVQLGASTMVGRVTSMSENLTEQLDRELATCRWFSIQVDESVDNSTAQLMIIIRMVFDDFSTNEELLTLLPLKTTTRGIHNSQFNSFIYNVVKNYFVEKKVPLEKLVLVITHGAPAMTGRHAGFMRSAKVIQTSQNFYTTTASFTSRRSKAKQHRIFKVLLEELSAEYGDLLLHTEM